MLFLIFGAFLIGVGRILYAGVEAVVLFTELVQVLDQAGAGFVEVSPAFLELLVGQFGFPVAVEGFEEVDGGDLNWLLRGDARGETGQRHQQEAYFSQGYVHHVLCCFHQIGSKCAVGTDTEVKLSTPADVVWMSDREAVVEPQWPEHWHGEPQADAPVVGVVG